MVEGSGAQHKPQALKCGTAAAKQLQLALTDSPGTYWLDTWWDISQRTVNGQPNKAQVWVYNTSPEQDWAGGHRPCARPASGNTSWCWLQVL